MRPASRVLTPGAIFSKFRFLIQELRIVLETRILIVNRSSKYTATVNLSETFFIFFYFLTILSRSFLGLLVYGQLKI